MKKQFLCLFVVCVVQQALFADEVVSYVPHSTEKISQLTGDYDRQMKKPTLNQTDKKFGIWGTDLGSTFEHHGKLYFLFGDTHGRPGDRDVLAWTDSHDPAHIQLHCHMSHDHKWLPLTVPGIQQGAFEIPSAGISLNDHMYVLCTTDHTEKKVMGRSVLFRSDDHGKKFTKVYDFSHTKFINAAYWRFDTWVYIFGAGDYRKSSVYLARSKVDQFEHRDHLEFFSGRDPEPKWSHHEADAVALFDQPQVGEFSVKYLDPLKQYVMLYNASKPRGINMRTAKHAWGPWSEESVIFEPWRDKGYGHFMHVSNKSEHAHDALSDPKNEEIWAGEYGPYLMHRFTKPIDGGCRIFYVMSTWNPYQVMVMKSDLKLETH